MGFLRGCAVGVLGAASAWAVVSRKFLVWPNPTNAEVRLGDPAYRVERIEAPAASGLLLRLLALVIGARGSLLAQHAARLLLNDNRLVRLRSLAAQIVRQGRVQALLHPMVRLSLPARAEHERLAKEAQEVRKRPGRYNSVLDYHAAFKAGESTPPRVLERVLSALDALPADLKVFRELVDRARLRAEAEASAGRYAAGKPRSPFDGVPVAFKDMVCVAGLNCTFGTDASWGTGADAKDDFTVAKLREAGAIVLGLTVMTEFGSTPLGYSVHARAPVNAYDPNCYAGGSSSGCGVGAALGLFPVALGFDGGGSIRIPAAMEGVVGLKCTWGRVAVDEEYLFPTVAAGPIAGSAADAALFYQVISQPAPTHFYQQLYGPTELPPTHCFGFNDVQDLSDLRVGVYQEWVDDCHPEVQARTQEMLAFLKQKGATVIPVQIPNLEVWALAHGVSISVDFTLQHERQQFLNPETLEAATRIQLALGGSMTGCELAATQWIRSYAMTCLADLFEDKELSVLFTPTLGTLPPRMPVAAKKTGESNTALVMQLLQYIFLGNLCGVPCISVPAGRSREGLPLAVHFMAKHWDEHVCLRMANVLDIPQFRSVPPAFVDLLGEGP